MGGLASHRLVPLSERVLAADKAYKDHNDGYNEQYMDKPANGVGRHKPQEPQDQ